jgi:hypothetical protein
MEACALIVGANVVAIVVDVGSRPDALKRHIVLQEDGLFDEIETTILWWPIENDLASAKCRKRRAEGTDDRLLISRAICQAEPVLNKVNFASSKHRRDERRRGS